MTDKQALDDVSRLYNLCSPREGKYLRNLNRYQNNGTRREDLWSPYVYPFLFGKGNPVADGYQTNINIIRSAVDTITSKVSQAKVRPFFNPVNGDIKSRIVARQSQQFFDAYFDEEKVYEESVDALRDAAIFECGVVYADDLLNKVQRIEPWTYCLDPAEYVQGFVTRALVNRKNYPLIILRDHVKGNARLKTMLEDDPAAKGNYFTHFDLYKGERRDFFGGELFSKRKIDYENENGLYKRPFAEIYWSRPVKSFFSVSLADELYTIQRAIDDQQNRIDAAFRNGLTNLILIPKQPGGEPVKSSQLSNAPAQVLEYIPSPDGGMQVVTPQAIHQQFIDYENILESKAYQLTGISQLSAQAKKPGGLNSGVALQTFEDIESERHNVITNSYVHFLVDVVKAMISTFPNNMSILPKSMGRSHVTWGQLKAQAKNYSVQFSAGSSLSKDPAVKLDQINKLVDAGMIDKEMAATYLDLPDLQGAYSQMTAAYDYACEVVDHAALTGEMDYLLIVPPSLLKKQCVVTMARLKTAGQDEKTIGNLIKLLEKITAQEQGLAMPDMPEPMAPPMPGPMPPAPMPPPPIPFPAPAEMGPSGEKVQDLALNGAQITALVDVASKVKTGELDPAAANAIIEAALPGVSPELVRAMVDQKINSPAVGGV